MKKYQRKDFVFFLLYYIWVLSILTKSSFFYFEISRNKSEQMSKRRYSCLHSLLIFTSHCVAIMCCICLVFVVCECCIHFQPSHHDISSFRFFLTYSEHGSLFCLIIVGTSVCVSNIIASRKIEGPS